MSHNSPVIKKKRKGISLDIKIEILDRLATGQGATFVGKHFGVHEATVRTIKKNEAAIRKSFVSGTKISAKSSSYTRDIVKQKMEKTLAIWIEDNSQKRIPVDGNTIKHTALQIYRQINEMEPGTSSQMNRKYSFTASTGWMTGFLKRHGLHNIKIKGEIVSTDEPAAKAFPQKLAKTMEDGSYTADKVCNADETGHFWKRKTNRTYVGKSEKTEDETIEVVLVTPEPTDHSDNDKEDPLLHPDLIKQGLELSNKLVDHFVTHDPNEERAGKFQRDLYSLMAPYKELYNGLVKTGIQRLITEFVRKITQTSEPQDAIGNIVQEITKIISSREGDDQNISSDSDDIQVLRKRMRLLSESDSQ